MSDEQKKQGKRHNLQEIVSDEAEKRIRRPKADRRDSREAVSEGFARASAGISLGLR